MRIRFVLILGLLFFCISCGKDKPSGGSNGNGDNGSEQTGGGVTTETSLFQSIQTNPTIVANNASSTNLLDSLIFYINATPKGAIIHLNVFLFNYPSMLTALKAASSRGVELDIIIDSSRDDSRSTNNSTILEIQKFIKSPSKFSATNNQINTVNAINHCKYVLFSEINLPKRGIAKNVVFATSHNFTVGQTKMIQDAIVMTNKDLYDAFVDNWNDLDMYAKNMFQFEYKTKQIGDSITAFFFPSTNKGGTWNGKDDLLDQLNSLYDLVDGNQPDFTKDTIKIFQSSTWNGNRGAGIVQKLTDLSNKGARVEVITMHDVTANIITELNALAGTGAYVKILDGTRGQVHSKVMIIKGFWKGKQQTMFSMGSENYGEGALKYSNNFMLRFVNSSLFSDYWTYYDKLKSSLF